ncbi:MAG: DNA mismatch repair endonuclease MutL, partial [Chloroflexota bacterium]
MTIRILPPDVAARIAAGEVVERPASVVKELIENALDAGASAIAVEVAGGGKRLIEVGDNGSGIRADEAELAFHRYATSKLTRVEDLDGIRTLGFRGEALASIAAVSRLTLVTRAADERGGTRLRLEGGEIVSREVVGAPQGTLVTIENLFFNVPARLKFLKKDATERKQVAALVSRYAMAYPGVRFSLVQAGREALSTAGSGSLQDVLSEVYGVDTAAQMIPIESSSPPRDDLPAIEVWGLVSLPELSRNNRSQIALFVNGRWIQDASLTYAVVRAYHTLLMQGRFPLAVVMVDLPPEEVDVNVHPTKAEVRFRRPDAVFSAVQRAVRRTLVDQAPARGVSEGVFWGQPDWAARRDRLSQVTQERLGQAALDLSLDRPGQVRQQQPPPGADVGAPAPQPRRSLPMLRVVGQVGATYIVAEGPQGLYLIDQHAAHERVLYEQFMAERAEQAIHSQELLEPLAVELLPEQMALLEESLGVLHAAGFVVEPFGRNTVQLRALPVIAAGGDPAEALLAALGEIECGE